MTFAFKSQHAMEAEIPCRTKGSTASSRDLLIVEDKNSLEEIVVRLALLPQFSLQFSYFLIASSHPTNPMSIQPTLKILK